MKIPNRFKQFAQTFEVIENPDLLVERDWVGKSSYRKNEIHILPDSPTFPRNAEQREHTFFHELVHIILYGAGVKGADGEYLHKDEDAVDLIGNLLHQAFTSFEFDEER